MACLSTLDPRGLMAMACLATLDPRGLMAMACLATLDPRDNCGQASLRLSVARARKCLRGKPSPVACNVTQCSDVM